MRRVKSSTTETSSWNRNRVQTRGRKSAKDWIGSMRLQLAIQEIPGDHTVFRRRLEEVGGEYTKRLTSTHHVPASAHEGISRAGAPAPFHLNRTVPFE